MNSITQEQTQNQIPTLTDDPLTSLTQLVEILKEAPIEEFVSISKSVKLTAEDVTDYATWNSDKYTRNCVEINDRFELILLCWEPGQKTPIHDHGGEECWVYFINSEFEEVIYSTSESGLEEIQSLKVSHGTVTYMTDFMGVHSLQNIGEIRGFSLHLYAKPIKSCNVFNDSIEEFELKEMNYDSKIEINK